MYADRVNDSLSVKLRAALVLIDWRKVEDFLNDTLDRGTMRDYDCTMLLSDND